jgi:hypothetical protein
LFLLGVLVLLVIHAHTHPGIHPHTHTMHHHLSICVTSALVGGCVMDGARGHEVVCPQGKTQRPLSFLLLHPNPPLLHTPHPTPHPDKSTNP